MVVQERLHLFDLIMSTVVRDGRAAVGTVLRGDDGTARRVTGRTFGHIGRVQASYRSLLRALWNARTLGARRLRVQTDDAELVAQLEGHVEVPPELIGLHLQVRAMLNAYRWSSVQWIAPDDTGEASTAALSALERQPTGTEVDEVDILPLWVSSELTAAGARR